MKDLRTKAFRVGPYFEEQYQAGDSVSRCKSGPKLVPSEESEVWAPVCYVGGL